MRLAATSLMIAATTLSAAFATLESTDAQLRATLERHRGVLDELRLMFEEDRTRHKLRLVYGQPDEWDRARSRCGRRTINCIPASRWEAYSTKLRHVGVEHIETHETPGIYFHVHRTLPPLPFGWSGPYRYRGVVYAPGFPKVVHNHDDTEERVDLGAGWYSYLIIDD
jgi:hypothetical protein